MSKVDARGCAISGATPAALDAYERAVAAVLGWRGGATCRWRGRRGWRPVS